MAEFMYECYSLLRNTKVEHWSPESCVQISSWPEKFVVNIGLVVVQCLAN